MSGRIAVNDPVLLLGPEGERHLVRAKDATERVAGLGVLALKTFVGKNWGDTVRLGLKDYQLLPPRLADHAGALERKAQIILPKDAARILYEIGAGAGDRIGEAGVGSGGLTVALAHAVAPAGRVFAYDLREDHLAVGRRNVERTPWLPVVDFRVADVRKEIPDRDLDAFVLDIPDPEAAIPAVHAAVRSGGTVACYTPLIGQAEAAVHALRRAGCADVRTLETIERPWVVHDRGARPDFEMLGHTAFLTFARRP